MVQQVTITKQVEDPAASLQNTNPPSLSSVITSSRTGCTRHRGTYSIDGISFQSVDCGSTFSELDGTVHTNACFYLSLATALAHTNTTNTTTPTTTPSTPFLNPFRSSASSLKRMIAPIATKAALEQGHSCDYAGKDVLADAYCVKAYAKLFGPILILSVNNSSDTAALDAILSQDYAMRRTNCVFLLHDVTAKHYNALIPVPSTLTTPTLPPQPLSPLSHSLPSTNTTPLYSPFSLPSQLILESPGFHTTDTPSISDPDNTPMVSLSPSSASTPTPQPSPSSLNFMSDTPPISLL